MRSNTMKIRSLILLPILALALSITATAQNNIVVGAFI
jgi:hypothetical protein